jgi:two-component system, NarL family, sensor kinase
MGQVVPFLTIAAVGLVIARHRPRSPIGWLLIAAASAMLTDDADLYVWLVYRLGHHLPLGPVALLLAFTQFTLYMTLPVAILLFPDGALPSLRWRWVLWAYLTVTGFLLVSVYAAVVSLIVAGDVRINASGDVAALDNPSGSIAWLTPVHTVIFPVMVAFWLSFAARLLLSWRHASIVRRQQLKWLLAGCAIALATGVISVVSGLSRTPRPPSREPPTLCPISASPSWRCALA